MFFLFKREEFAETVNFGKYPVISLDVADKSKQSIFDGEVVGFDNIDVRIPTTKGYTINGEMRWYIDSKKITFGSSCVCLSSSFSYQDAMEDVRYANAPMVDKNEEFVLILHNSQSQKVMALILKIDDYKDINCQTVLQVNEKIDLMELANLLK